MSASVSLSASTCRWSPRVARLDERTRNIQEAVSLHLEGENLEELGFAANPTILATLELEAVA